MAKKTEVLFPKQVRPAAEVSAERQEMLRRYEAGYVFRKDMLYKPNISLPWWGQVLDLKAQGKPTTYVAYQMAIEAQRRAGNVATRYPGEDMEEDNA